METLLHDFFRAVSFEPGERPSYQMIYGLFVPGGLLVKAVGAPEVATVEEFIAPRVALVESGALTEFHESERSGETQVFGNVAAALVGLRQARRAGRGGVRGRRPDLHAVRPHAIGVADHLDGVGRRALEPWSLCEHGSFAWGLRLGTPGRLRR